MIEPNQIPVFEYNDRKKERLAELRLRNEIPLSYDDFETLSGIPRSTLENWRCQGRLIALPDAEGKAPRFAVDELYRILGGGKHRGAERTENNEHDESEATRHEQMANPILLHRSVNGQKDTIQGGISGHSERGPGKKRSSKGRSSGRKRPVSKSGDGSGLRRLLCDDENH